MNRSQGNQIVMLSNRLDIAEVYEQRYPNRLGCLFSPTNPIPLSRYQGQVPYACDVVANKIETLKWWERWVPRLEHLGWPLALAVQDGMTINDVRALDRQPEVIFVGGTDNFKWRTLMSWCREFQHVHTGRVGTRRLLWMSDRCGAKSCDGSAWWYRKSLKDLESYLSRSAAGQGEKHRGFFY